MNDKFSELQSNSTDSLIVNTANAMLIDASNGDHSAMNIHVGTQAAGDSTVFAALTNMIFFSGYTTNEAREDVVEQTQYGAFTGTVEATPSGAGPAFIIKYFQISKAKVRSVEAIRANYLSGGGGTSGELQSQTVISGEGTVDKNGVIEYETLKTEVSSKTPGGMNAAVNLQMKLAVTQMFDVRAGSHYNAMATASALQWAVDDNALDKVPYTWVNTDGINFDDLSVENARLWYETLIKPINEVRSLIDELHSGLPDSSLVLILNIKAWQLANESVRNTQFQADVLKKGIETEKIFNNIPVFIEIRVDLNEFEYTPDPDLPAGAERSPYKGTISGFFHLRGASQSPLTYTRGHMKEMPRGISSFIFGWEFYYGSWIVDPAYIVTFGLQETRDSIIANPLMSRQTIFNSEGGAALKASKDKAEGRFNQSKKVIESKEVIVDKKASKK